MSGLIDGTKNSRRVQIETVDLWISFNIGTIIGLLRDLPQEEAKMFICIVRDFQNDFREWKRQIEMLCR